MRVLRGVVYMTKSSGPRNGYARLLGGHRKRKCARRTGRFHILHESSEMTDDLNQLRTEPWIPNQDERRVIKMVDSVESSREVE